MRINSNAIQSFSPQSGIKVAENSNIKVDKDKSINEAIKLDLSSNETIIQARNGYVNEEIDKRDKILEEHYSKMYQENIKFENLTKHIWNKYYTENSPYYIKGLTNEERDIAYHTEIGYLNTGSIFSGQGSYDDAVLKGKKTLVFDDIMRAEERAFNREAVNSQFQILLNKNSITIPENEKLIFTIDPNFYKVSVNGAKDENLAKIIEEMLNKNSENVKQLFLHIIGSKFEENTQFTKEKQDKLSIVNSIKEVTGYNLADLEVQGDKFVTPEGQDIFDIYKENFGHRKSLTENERNYVLIEQQNKLTALARKGFENVPDLVLSIEYENGSFYDIGQKENFGTGKTDWIEKWNIAKTNDYNATQDKTNYISPYNENPYEFLNSINKYDLINEISNVTGFNLNDLKEVNGKFLTENGSDIFDIYKEDIQSKYFFSKDLQEAQLNHYGNLLYELAKVGYNTIADFKFEDNNSTKQTESNIKSFEVYA